MSIKVSGVAPLGVTEVARGLGVKRKIVLGWIASGELPALDMSRTRALRPSYRIAAEALEKFKAARLTTNRKASPAPRRRRAPRKNTSPQTWV